MLEKIIKKRVTNQSNDRKVLTKNNPVILPAPDFVHSDDNPKYILNEFIPCYELIKLVFLLTAYRYKFNLNVTLYAFRQNVYKTVIQRDH